MSISQYPPATAYWLGRINGIEHWLKAGNTLTKQHKLTLMLCNVVNGPEETMCERARALLISKVVLDQLKK